MDFVWVAVGGALGAVCRYALGIAITDRFGADFPIHTFVINVSGSLAIGVLVVLLTERLVADPMWRLLAIVGFLGGYTTFSSYTFEAVALAERGAWLSATLYVVGSNGIGLVATWLGMLVARALPR